MIDYSALPRTLLMLAMFGCLYNWLVVDRIERHLPPQHGVTAFEVVAGVLVTMVVFGMLAGWEDMLLALFLFSGSGIPMILGSHWRHGEIAA